MSKRSGTVAAETCVALGATDPRVTSYSNREVRLALPDSHRQIAATFAHVAEVPPIDSPGGRVSVFAGSLLGQTSPAVHFSEILAADLQVHGGHELGVPLQPAFEHALLVLSGDARLADQPLEERVLYYLGTTRSDVHISSHDGCRVLLIGGPPFPEEILMWWNFVARTQEEIAQARADWEDRNRFGDVAAYKGSRLNAPSLVRFARPNPLS
jgi:redox-sensitive bicupin YhaK (pirin superfamily)